MIKGLFVTGTDTGVGKTRAGAALACLLASAGRRVHVRKPVESGCPEGQEGLVPQDAEALRLAAGAIEPSTVVCRYRLRAPLSPERAAALEGRSLEVPDLLDACVAGVSREGILLVEGAGGFLSPIARGALNADLARALGLPVLIVAADRLGVINHCLLTVEAVRARGLGVAGVVLSQPAPVAPDMDNAGELRRWLGLPVLSLPHGDAAGPKSWCAEAPVLAPVAALMHAGPDAVRA